MPAPGIATLYRSKPLAYKYSRTMPCCQPIAPLTGSRQAVLLRRAISRLIGAATLTRNALKDAANGLDIIGYL